MEEEKPPAPKMTLKVAEKRITGLIAEWFQLFAFDEMALSIQEIDPEFHPLLIHKLVEACGEHKLEHVSKTAAYLVESLNSEDGISSESLSEG